MSRKGNKQNKHNQQKKENTLMEKETQVLEGTELTSETLSVKAAGAMGEGQDLQEVVSYETPLQEGEQGLDAFAKAEAPVIKPEIAQTPEQVEVAQAPVAKVEDVEAPEPERKPIHLLMMSEYAKVMGNLNTPTDAQVGERQRKLFACFNMAFKAESVEVGAKIFGEIAQAVKENELEAFTLARMQRGLGRRDVLKSVEDTELFRVTVTVLNIITNPSFRNEDFINMTKVADILDVENKDFILNIFRRVAGLDNE